ncbi:MAG: hypothetical protein JXK07_10000 [Spirochaetes bacterium]|nr:hypothetical protein [Spirochaetota bacterium]MBN2771270.1 hypothetical protein [Spirochaetota bacterium]
MILDHITYFQNIVVSNIVDGAATNLLHDSFYEIVPSPSEITNNLPCCTLSSLVSPPRAVETDDERIVEETTIRIVKKEYETTHTYTLKFFSKDIYHHIENSDDPDAMKPFVVQVHDYLHNHKHFTKRNGHTVSVRPGIFGYLDDANIIKDGIYMSYCQVVLTDGLYSERIIPRITDAHFEQGGLY